MWLEGAARILHVVADLAVIAAVVIGGIEFYSHRGERKESTEAIDAHIRVLTIQARVLIDVESRGNSIGQIANRLVTRGSAPGDMMALWLTAIAAEAPQASPELRRTASEVASLFFQFAEHVEHLRTTLSQISDNDPGLIDYIQRLKKLLQQAAPAPVGTT